MKVREYVEDLVKRSEEIKKQSMDLKMADGKFQDDVKALLTHLGMKPEGEQVNIVDVLGSALKAHYKEMDDK